MVSKLAATDMAYLISILLGIIAAGILYFYERVRTYSVRWLTLAYLMINLAFFVIFLYRTRLIEELPHFYRTGGIFMLLYMPFSYLFIRTTLSERPANRWDILHAIPALIYIIDFAPFLLTPADQKLSIILIDYDRALFNFSYGTFLSEQFHRLLLTLTPLIYWVAQLVVLVRWFYKSDNAARLRHGIGMKWIMFYISFQALLLTPLFLFFLFDEVVPFFEISFVFTVMNTAFIGFSLFIRPGTEMPSGQDFVYPLIHNQLPPDIPMKFQYDYPMGGAKDAVMEHEMIHAPRHVKPLEKLTRKQLSHMKYELEFFLQRNQPFLQHSYSLQELATSLSFPLYQLSALINQEYKTNFNDLINKYRIEHALHIIKEGKNNNLNINGLADRCGFNNRNSFTNAFKKFTGLTPSDYFKDFNT